MGGFELKEEEYILRTVLNTLSENSTLPKYEIWYLLSDKISINSQEEKTYLKKLIKIITFSKKEVGYE